MKVLAPVKKYETLRDPTIMHQECSVRYEKPSISPAYMSVSFGPGVTLPGAAGTICPYILGPE